MASIQITHWNQLEQQATSTYGILLESTIWPHPWSCTKVIVEHWTAGFFPSKVTKSLGAQGNRTIAPDLSTCFLLWNHQVASLLLESCITALQA